MVNVPNAGVPITGALAMARDWYKFFTDLVRETDAGLAEKPTVSEGDFDPTLAFATA